LNKDGMICNGNELEEIALVSDDKLAKFLILQAKAALGQKSNL